MSEEQSLDDILNDDVPAPEVDEAPVVEDKPEVVETESEKPETGEEAESESAGSEGEKGEPPAPKIELSERERAFLAKGEDEKRKRQDLERELQEFRSQAAQPKATPDPIEDPEGFIRDQDQKRLNDRISMSQELMRSQHQDYDEKEIKFVELVKTNPHLYQQMSQSANPAKFAYEAVMREERLNQFDSLDDTLKAKEDALKQDFEKQMAEKEKQIREDIEKEYKEKYQSLAGLPPSGAGNSKGSDNTSVGFETLEDILA